MARHVWLAGRALDARPEETEPSGEIRCRSEAPACINEVMASSAQPTHPIQALRLPLVRRGGSGGVVRAPSRRGVWSPEEVAHALKQRRPELRGALERRMDARDVPALVREEIVDEAIGLVVMSRDPIRNEQHLIGAYWRSVRYLLAERRAGRDALRVGSRQRVGFEQIIASARAQDAEPFELLAVRERLAEAADWMAQLDPFERRVVAMMAVEGLRVKLAARALGEPVKTVLAAARSADRKLEQVAAIAAAGRMCEYRRPAIMAHAQGTAQARQEQFAKAHLAACPACHSSYDQMLREMGSPEFQRAASAAFLPPPLAVVAGHGWIERLLGLLPNNRVPSGGATGERAAGLLGGGGVVKVAATSTALLIAGAGIGAHVIHSLSGPEPVHRHHATRVATVSRARASIQPVSVAEAMQRQSTPAARPATKSAEPAHRSARRSPPPPSRGLGYLALGESAGGGASASPSAQAASATPRESRVEEGPPEHVAQTGGGTSLGYLGG